MPIDEQHNEKDSHQKKKKKKKHNETDSHKKIKKIKNIIKQTRKTQQK